MLNKKEWNRVCKGAARAHLKQAWTAWRARNKAFVGEDRMPFGLGLRVWGGTQDGQKFDPSTLFEESLGQADPQKWIDSMLHTSEVPYEIEVVNAWRRDKQVPVDSTPVYVLRGDRYVDEAVE